LANPSSPSLELVHATASVYKRFESWLKRACKNYGDLLDWKAIVDNVLRRERAKDPALDVEQRAKVTDAIEEYDKLDDVLLKLAKYKAFETFGWTGENFIKWVGDETVSVGYSGLRERSAQYLLSDIVLTPELPLEKKARDVLGFYGVERLAVLRIPTREESVRELLDFLENVKKWPRDRLTWVVEKVYPLDSSGGFWTVSQKVVALESVWDAWEDIMDSWRSKVTAELKKALQFEVLKTILMAEWEAEKYLERDVFESVKNEFMVKYGETTEEPEKVKVEFFERAKVVLSERAPVETKIVEVYEQVKSLVPAEKVELTRAGLWKAIRWAFLHPQVLTVDAFASSWVFPLGFTTEEARAIGSAILEKVVKKPVPLVRYTKVRFLVSLPSFVGADMKTYGPYKEGDIAEVPSDNAHVLVRKGVVSYELVPPPPSPPPPPVVPKVVLTNEEKNMLNIFFLDKLKGAGIAEPEKYKPEFEKALDVGKNYEYNLAVARDVADDIIERVRPIAKMIEVHVKVKVSEGEDLGTYVAMLMYDVFEVIFLGLTSTPALKTFLESGEEWVDFTEQYRMAGFEEEEMATHLAELPYPFSTGARIRVYWKYPEDVEFTEKAKEWWDTYYRVYSREALEALTVPALTDIAKIKQVKVPKTKAELIASILGLAPPPALPPALAPPPLPPAERPLWELPEQIKQLTEDLEKEAYATFIAAGLPYEEWLKHRATISLQIKSAVDMFGGAKKLEAEKKVRESVAKFVSDLIEKVKKPPPEVVVPPAVVPAVFPPAVEIVYAPREKPLSEEELKALHEEILGMPYEKAVDEYLKAITEGRTADVDAWKKKFAESSELVKMKRKIVK